MRHVALSIFTHPALLYARPDANLKSSREASVGKGTVADTVADRSSVQ